MPNVLPAMREWYEQDRKATLERAKVLHHQLARSTPKVRTPATEHEQQALRLLQGVCYPVASNWKRFARDMAGAKELTDAQRGFLWRTVWRFRRQIDDAGIVAIAKANAEGVR
jgi:hypothetical protein